MEMILKPKLLKITTNKLVYFNNPDKLWIVNSGEVELYLIELDADRVATSTRKYLFKATPGTVILSCSNESFAGGVTLMGTAQDARLIEYSSQDMKMFSDPLFLSGLEEWVNNIATHFLEQIRPIDFSFLEKGTMDEFRRNSTFAPKNDLLWVKIKQGDFHILGNPDLPAEGVEAYNKSAFIPVNKYFWLAPQDKKGELAVVSSTDIPQHQFFEKCINPLRNYSSQALNQRFKAKILRDQQLILNKKENNQRLIDTSLQKLNNILVTEKSSNVFIRNTQQNDALFACCQIIGSAMDKEVVKPKYFSPKDTNNALFLIAQASSMRFRKVILRGNWWQQENGHLLVYEKETKQPQALIQSNTGAYQIIDPLTGKSKKITQKIAESLDPVAHMFFVTFDKPIKSFQDLVVFAFKGVKKDAYGLGLAAFLGSLIGLLIPILSDLIFDDVIPTADRNYLWEIVAILVVVGIVQALLKLVEGILLIRLETKSNITMQAGLMDHLIRLPIRFFKQYSAGDLTLRALTANSIRQIASNTLLSATLAGAFSIINLALLYYYDSKLAWIGLGLALFGFLFIVGIGVLKLKYDRYLAETQGEIQGLLFQFLSGIDKIRISGAESRIFSLWAEKFKELKTLNFKSGSYQNWVEVFKGSFPLITNLFFFFFIYYYFEFTQKEGGSGAEEIITVGSFIAFITAYGQFLGESLNMGFAFITSLNIIPLYERVQPILEAKSETTGEFKDVGQLVGDIEFNQVSFRYDPDAPLVLDDINFRIKAGEMVAFVGPSGSGKSTVLKILLGFEKPESGSVYYDGLEFLTLNKDLLRQQLGVVLQNGALMPGSIMKNIIGDAAMTITDAWDAAKMAGIEQDIKEMPMGIHTVISEGSSTISGGQKQRLMIARALVHKPRVIMMDEATSALDNRTQKIVKDSLDRLQATRIVVAHRLSTIEKADRIFVFDRGKIVQEGSYQTLLNQDGLFAKLAKRQIL